MLAGKGGDGVVSFRREKFVDHGGPDGGDGGHGGDIVLAASPDQNTLAAFRHNKLIKAKNGEAGGRHRRHGKSAPDHVVKVPVGTLVTDVSSGRTLVDLAGDGQQAVVARGGKGGFGNAHFISSTRQAPRVAEKGEPGEAIEATLELKLIADVGLIGLPNAGKSTLLAAVSHAHPKIADYPFTTLEPNLGVVDLDKKTSLVMADIPGLIAGAHQGKGLGDEFLRHIERTSVLVHLIDVYSNNVAAAYRIIIDELKAYRVDLSRRPQIVALTKVEGLDKELVAEQLGLLKKAVPRSAPRLAISSFSREGLKELLTEVNKQIASSKKASSKRPAKPKLTVIGPPGDTDSWQVKKRGSRFIVTGSKIEQFARRTRFEDEHGRQRLRDIMGKLGISHELRRQGIEDGQVVVIGQPPLGELEY